MNSLSLSKIVFPKQDSLKTQTDNWIIRRSVIWTLCTCMLAALSSFPLKGQSYSFKDDRDGNNYKYVKIGDQFWFAENLAYLPNVNGRIDGSNDVPRYYIYGFDGTNTISAKESSNYHTYGVLYNWKAAIIACPKGWHLPSKDEYMRLVDYFGSSGKPGIKLKSFTSWKNNSGGTNTSGFSALPSGKRDATSTYVGIGRFAHFWLATETKYGAYYGILGSGPDSGINGESKRSGFSVRCIKD